MADSTAQAVAPEALTSGAGPAGPHVAPRSARRLGVLPFGVYVDPGPARTADRGRDRGLPEPGPRRLHVRATSSTALQWRLPARPRPDDLPVPSLVLAIMPGILGLLIAYAIWSRPSAGNGAAAGRDHGASAVFANFGGVPLAFLFIATLGSSGHGHQVAHGPRGVQPVTSTASRLYSAERRDRGLPVLPDPADGADHLWAFEGLRPAGGARPHRTWARGRGSTGGVPGRAGADAVVPRLPAAAVRQRVSAPTPRRRPLTSGTIPRRAIQYRFIPQRQRAGGPAERRQGARPGAWCSSSRSSWCSTSLLQRRAARWLQ